MKCKAYNTPSHNNNRVSTVALVFRLILILYLAFIAYLCFWRFKDLPKFDFPFPIQIDKVVHFCMFFPFPIISFLAYGKQIDTFGQFLKSFLTLCSFGCVIAGITEIIQNFIPYRSEDIMDFLADCIGVCLSTIIVLIIALSRSSKKRYSIPTYHPGVYNTSVRTYKHKSKRYHR